MKNAITSSIDEDSNMTLSLSIEEHGNNHVLIVRQSNVIMNCGLNLSEKENLFLKNNPLNMEKALNKIIERYDKKGLEAKEPEDEKFLTDALSWGWDDVIEENKQEIESQSI